MCSEERVTTIKQAILTNPFKNQIVTAFLFVLFLLFIYHIRSTLVLLFVSYIIMASLLPVVAFLVQRRIPKVLATTIAFFSLLVIIIMLIVPLIPFLAGQTQTLFNRFPDYVQQSARLLGVPIDAALFTRLATTEIDVVTSNAISVTRRLFGGFFSTLTIVVLSFYMLLEREKIDAFLIAITPRQQQKRAKIILHNVTVKLGAWLRGQIVLSFFIGIITWIVLTLIGLDFALPLALIAGMLEILPTIGPILSAIPAIIVALTLSPQLALTVAGMYVLIQLLENNILVPRIMQQAVGLSPIVIILGVIIGGELLGVAGSLLSIPFISLLVVVYRGVVSKTLG